MIKGVDVSRHNGAIDWVKLRAAEIQFAFIRATFGLDVDIMFRTNWEQCGIERGAYHFLHADQDGFAQARCFIETLHGNVGSLPPVLDVEEQSIHAQSPERVVDVAIDFARGVEEALSVRPLLYTNPNTALLLGESIARLHERMPRLWLADYRATITIPWPWSTWDFLQHGTGNLDGAPTKIDLDRFVGTFDDLRMQLQLAKVWDCR